MYDAAFRRPFTIFSAPTPLAAIQPQTCNFPPPCIMVALTQSGWYRSFFLYPHSSSLPTPFSQEKAQSLIHQTRAPSSIVQLSTFFSHDTSLNVFSCELKLEVLFLQLQSHSNQLLLTSFALFWRILWCLLHLQCHVLSFLKLLFD